MGWLTGDANEIVADRVDAKVQAKFEKANQLVDTGITDLSGYIDDIRDALQTNIAGIDDIPIPEIADAGIPEDFIINSTPPEALTNLPDAIQPDDPELVTVDPITENEKTVTLPNVAFPALFGDDYDITLPTHSISFPGINFPTMPAEPDIDSMIPDPLNLSDIVIPTMPPLDMNVSWDGVRPAWSEIFTIPSFSYDEPDYSSAVYNSLVAWLTGSITALGTGLSAEVEAAIYARLTARQDSINEKVVGDAEDYFSSRGWSLPPGMLMARIYEAGVEVARANALLSNEIMIKQAELAQANTHFIMDMAVKVEEVTRQYATQIAQRLLDSEKAAVEAGNMTVRLLIEKHAMLVETYKADAQVYEQRIRAELLKLEQFKTQMEGVKVEAQVQQTMAEIYKTSLQGVVIMVDVYKARIGAASAIGEMERLKIEELKARISLHETNIQGATLALSSKELLLKRETGQVAYISEQLRAAGLEIDRRKAESQLTTDDVDRQKTMRMTEIEANRNILEGYKEKVAAFNGLVDALTKKYGFEVEGYKAAVQGEVSQNEGLVKIAATKSEIMRTISAAEIAKVEAKIRVAIAESERATGATTEIAKIVSQIIHSALTSINVSLGESYSGAANQSYQVSNSEDRVDDSLTSSSESGNT